MLNTITIMGRLTRDPELRRTAAGVAVASFSVAVDRDFAQDGKKETDFIDCVAWRQTGEFVSKFFTKGKMIVVKGRLQIRSWKDKDGNNRRSAEVVADNCYFAESKRDTDGGNNSGYFNSGYSGEQSAFSNAYAQAGYAQPPYENDFAMLDDDDSKLPF